MAKQGSRLLPYGAWRKEKRELREKGEEEAWRGGTVEAGPGGLEPFSTLAVIRLEPGGGRADSHPGRVAQVLCEASGCAAGILGGH